MVLKDVFPKFITIPEFKIGKSIIVILGHCMKINISIAGKVIGKAVVTAMAITKENKLD
jgi:hypothetical protein